MILCDLCGESRECLQKEIDGKEFDICAGCWRPLEEKLKGKGRVKKPLEIVYLPQFTLPDTVREDPKPLPKLPPEIIGARPEA
jgi:hypothetical protein